MEKIGIHVSETLAVLLFITKNKEKRQNTGLELNSEIDKLRECRRDVRRWRWEKMEKNVDGNSGIISQDNSNVQ